MVSISCSSEFYLIAVLLLLPSSVGATSSEQLFFKEGSVEGQVVEVKVGQSAVLDCGAGGSPGPTIHWLYKGDRVEQGNKNVDSDAAVYENTQHNSAMTSLLKLSSTKSRLFIDCVKPSDGGVYVCVAETPTKRISITIHLKVVESEIKRRRRNLGKHQHQHNNLNKIRASLGLETLASEGCVQKRQSSDVPARIYMWTTDRLELEGADVQLYCRADGSPNVKVTWFDRDNEPINTNDHYQVLENGDLLIKKVSWLNNMGLYRCVAENNAGSDHVTTFLYPTTK